MEPTTRSPSVDDLLTAATNDAEQRISTAELVPYTFRNDADVRKEAEIICRRHGVSLAAFLRAAQRSLVETYGG